MYFLGVTYLIKKLYNVVINVMSNKKIGGTNEQ